MFSLENKERKVVFDVLKTIGIGCLILFSIYLFGLSSSGETASDRKFGLISLIFFVVIGSFVFLYKFTKFQKKDKELNNFSWKGGNFDKFLGKEILQLRLDTQKLIELNDLEDNNFYDYSFIIQPYAKAFEGFLKKVLVELKIVGLEEFKVDPSIPINKFFNPKDGIVKDNLPDKKRDKAIPSVIFSVYQECRNDILHFDLYRDHRIKDVNGAIFLYRRISDAIEKTYESFIINKKSK